LVTAEKPDLENEVCDYNGTKPYYKALVTRYLKATAAVDGMASSMFPLREMHQLKTAGCGKGIEFDDKEKTIHVTAHVVDESAVKKVKAGAYIGFSQGGAYVGDVVPDPVFKGCVRYVADPGEVSLVDSPCLPEALLDSITEKTFTYTKADGSVELRKYNIVKPAPGTENPEAAELLKAATPRLKLAGKAKLGKGMYTVQDMARLVDSLKWIQDSVKYEAEVEGDGSAMPEALAQLLVDAVGCFMELANEETQELLAALKVAKGDPTMTPEQIKALEDKLAKSEAAVAKGKLTMKSLHDHLGKAMEMCKGLMGNDDEESEDAKKVREAAEKKAADEAVAKAAADELEKAKAAALAAGGSKTYTPAEIAELVKKGIADAKAEEEVNKTKLTLVGRDGQTVDLTKAKDANDLANVGF
jgi:hypothetical protein